MLTQIRRDITHPQAAAGFEPFAGVVVAKPFPAMGNAEADFVLLVRTKDCLVRLVRMVVEGKKQIAVRLGVVRLDLQCPSVAGLGLIGPAQFLEGFTQKPVKWKYCDLSRRIAPDSIVTVH
jgi:hypothetical protein